MDSAIAINDACKEVAEKAPRETIDKRVSNLVRSTADALVSLDDEDMETLAECLGNAFLQLMVIAGSNDIDIESALADIV